jgi:TonB family protein
MENLSYLLKASMGILAFYGFYWLVLRQHTYFAFNRFYLLTALFLSLTAPLIELPTEPMPVFEANANVSTFVMPQTLSIVHEAPPFDWQQFGWILYAIGVAVMAIRFVRQLYLIFNIIKKSDRFDIDNQTITLTPDAQVPTFSFFKWLVINPKYYEKYFDTVLSHETIHAQEGHSFDLILAEIVHIVLWFNPVLIYYKRSLRQIHEYLADDQTDTTDRQQYAQKLFGYVFQVEAIPLTNSFLDSLTLKNRIKMLYQKRSSRWVLGRYLLALPLLGLLITLVAARVAEPTEKVSERITVRGQVITQSGVGLPGVTVVVKNGTSGSSTDVRGNFIINVEKGQTLVFSFVGFKAEEREIRKEKMTVMMEQEPMQLSEIVVVGNSDIPPPMQPNAPTQNKVDEVFTVVEQQPEFEGGSNELNKFIGQNMKYPATAARANVEGKVFIQFDISETGETSNIEILKGIGFGCDEEAVRVVSIMPKWKPGRQSGKPVAVRFYLPVSFMLEKAHERKTTIEATPVAQPLWKGDTAFKIRDKWVIPGEQIKDKSVIFSQKKHRAYFGDKKPLYLIDGFIVENDKELNSLNPDDILTIHIWKDIQATRFYGSKAKDGVIIIETKRFEGFTNYKLKMPDTKIKADNLDLNENVTYFIENEKITKEEMEKIKPEDIESVNVQKKDKGKNSTVIITLKKKKE